MLWSRSKPTAMPLTPPGARDDRIIIDGRLGVSVVARGMSGDDELVVLGKTAFPGNDVTSASYLPSMPATASLDGRDSFSGVIQADNTHISFAEFEPAGSITIEDVPTVTVSTSYGGPTNSADVLEIEKRDAGHQISGTMDGDAMVPLVLNDTTSRSLWVGAMTWSVF